MPAKKHECTAEQPAESRRGVIKKISTAALAAPPAITMIMAATGKPAEAGPPYGVPPFGLPPGPPN